MQGRALCNAAEDGIVFSIKGKENKVSQLQPALDQDGQTPGSDVLRAERGAP